MQEFFGGPQNYFGREPRKDGTSCRQQEGLRVWCGHLKKPIPSRLEKQEEKTEALRSGVAQALPKASALRAGTRMRLSSLSPPHSSLELDLPL